MCVCACVCGCVCWCVCWCVVYVCVWSRSDSGDFPFLYGAHKTLDVFTAAYHMTPHQLYTLLIASALQCHPPTIYDSSVGTAASYGLEGPVSETLWRRDFTNPSRPALGPTQTPVQWSLSRGVNRPGFGVDHTTHLAPKLKKE
jgi:hypothetical protein